MGARPIPSGRPKFWSSEAQMLENAAIAKALEKMEAGRSEPPPPTLSAAPNKSILKTFLFLPAVSNRLHPRQRPSIRLKNYLVGRSTRAAISAAIHTVTKTGVFNVQWE